MTNFEEITNEPLDYCVYCHINKQTKEVYVGITNNTGCRWAGKEDKYKGCPDFYPALQEYGWDGFDHIILMDGIPKSVALIYEHELIKKYDLVNSGYNRSYGSWNTSAPRRFSPPVYQYTLTGEFVRKWNYTSEAVAKYGPSIYDNLNKKTHRAYNYQWSYEYVDKMSPYSTKVVHNYLPVFQYSLEGQFIKAWTTMQEAIDQYGRGVVLCTKGISLTAHGYMWSSEKVEKLPPLPPPVSPLAHYQHYRLPYSKTQKVYKYNLDGEIVAIYKNIESINDPDVDTERIVKSCKQKKYCIHNNMIWMYEINVDDNSIESIIEKYWKQKQHYKIIQYDLEGNYIKTFSGYKEIEEYGYLSKTINNACLGYKKTAYGYQWRKESSPPPGKVELRKKTSITPIIQKTLDGKVIRVFKDINEIVLEIKAKNPEYILNVCRGKKILPMATNGNSQPAKNTKTTQQLITMLIIRR